jgi:hypothetical protein
MSFFLRLAVLDIPFWPGVSLANGAPRPDRHTKEGAADFRGIRLYGPRKNGSRPRRPQDTRRVNRKRQLYL